MSRSIQRSAVRLSCALLAAISVTIAVCGCGGSSSGGDPPLASLLRDVPSTPQTRARIVSNDFTSLGVSHGGMRVLDQDLADGTPLGSGLIGAGQPSALGYDVLKLGGEIAVGTNGEGLSVIDGTFDPRTVGDALTRYGLSRTRSGSATEYAGPAKVFSSLAPVLDGVRRLLVLPNRILAAGPGVPVGELEAVAHGRAAAHSLAGDPDVATTLRLLGPSASVGLGTDLVGWPGAGASLQASHAIVGMLSLQRLSAPTFGGYAMVSPGRWRVVALYRSHAAAAQTAGIVASALRDGTSPIEDVRYARLEHLDAVHVEGRAVLLELTSSMFPQMIAHDDVPLFWAPPAGA